MLPNGDVETEPARDGMREVRETRKGEWWQVHGRSAAEVRCAAVKPSAECVACHGPEKLQHQMLRPANVVSERRGHALDRVRACMLVSCFGMSLAPNSPPVATVAFQVAFNTAHRE